MNVQLVTVVGASTDVLPHMLSHYYEQGVHSQLVHIHAAHRDDPLIERVKDIADSHGAEIASITVAPWSESINPILYKLSRGTAREAWFVLADSDELQRYPDGLVEALRFCDRRGYTFLEGCFVDRIAENGLLMKVEPGENIWKQFPLGACISGPLLGAVINKVVAAKGSVHVGWGQHHGLSGVRCPASELYIPVHHFKWIDGLIERLQDRIKIYNLLGEALGVESERFISYYGKDRCIRLDDPRFLVAPCAPDYPHWERLREWRIASSFFQVF
jgi:hypothetical protein